MPISYVVAIRLRTLLVRLVPALGLLVAHALAPGAPHRLLAQDMEVPVATQVALLSRIFAFDRTFGERAGAEIVVAIAYQPRVRESLNARAAVHEALRAIGGFGDVPIRIVDLEVGSGAELRASLDRVRPAVLYLAPLRAVDPSVVAMAAREFRALTCTGVPAYVDLGIAVGIGASGGRPQILINLTAARAVGAVFSSELLKLARVVG